MTTAMKKSPGDPGPAGLHLVEDEDGDFFLARFDAESQEWIDEAAGVVRSGIADVRSLRGDLDATANGKDPEALTDLQRENERLQRENDHLRQALDSISSTLSALSLSTPNEEN